MADLTFIEKLSRWLTNTQVKIKTEASESNTQSQTLALLLSKIDRKIDAIQHPSPDKENLTAIDLQASFYSFLHFYQETFSAYSKIMFSDVFKYEIWLSKQCLNKKKHQKCDQVFIIFSAIFVVQSLIFDWFCFSKICLRLRKFDCGLMFLSPLGELGNSTWP